MELDRLNPVTIITGAASGIGAACASMLSRRSEGGLILVDFDEAALDKTADSLSQPPERVSTLAFDVADPDRWADAAHFIQAQYGRLDWAIVNAGVAHSAPIAETDLVDWRRVMSTNLDGAFLTLRAMMPLMRENSQGGSIVVTASAAALKAEPGVGAYAASKAGLLQLMRVAAKEGAPDNIRVNAIAPGGVETPMWSSMPWFQDLVLEQGSERAAFDTIAKMATPLARYASSDDIARLIVMLLSDESPLTGATLVVDGGYTI
ncbi:MAG TPA: SDR family oxidoreductase [Terricaulis sp.]|nr:SDR family oxidoreductase [Terricaulis sp.]HRP10339.1 SDR family oxidoreductase [Terricaulis sp.]